MNVSLRPLKLFQWLVMLLPVLAIGQNFDPIERLTVVEGQTIPYTFSSIGGTTQTFIYSQTNNCGSAIGPQRSGVNSYKILFSASRGCFTKDTVTIYLRKPPQGAQTIRLIEFTIIPSTVIADNDFKTTAVNQPVYISVKDNDYSNRGVLLLNNVALVNNGQASIQGDSIKFTPPANFEGLANFNYVVCDDLGTCDAATVHVCVGDPYGYNNDTLLITTNKDVAVPILTPLDNYNLTTAPANGSLNNSTGILYYEPNAGFIGFDEAVYTDPATGQTKTVQVHMLNVKAPNNFLQPDLAHTIIDNSIEIDVLENDLGGRGLYQVGIATNPQNGILTSLPVEGLYLYTPNAGFEGIDEFEYTASPNSNGTNPETQKVHVIVSDLVPAAPAFNLQTPVNTPLVINYNIPVEAFDFNVTSQPNNGSVIYLQGHVDTTIAGQQVVGYNLLVYTPNTGQTGPDEFELEYCVDGNTNCFTAKVNVDVQSINPPNGGSFCISTDCVWAGDANKDGKVTLKDLLPIGLCLGEVGKPRPSATLSPWYGQACDDWGQKLPGARIDIKHMDTNGDSLVTAADTLAISQHYQKNNSISPTPVNFPTNIPLFLGNPDTIFVPGPGDIIQIPIFLGDPNLPAEDIYGINFNIDFDPNVFDPNQSQVIFDHNSWLSYSSPVLTMAKRPFDGRLEAGYTRTNGLSSSGYGRIGMVSFIVVDDLDGTRPGSMNQVSISGGSMNSGGISFDLNGNTISIPFGGGSDKDDEANAAFGLNPDQLLVYPNPTRDRLNIHLNGGVAMRDLLIYDFSGRMVRSESAMGSNGIQLDVSGMVPGFYIARVFTDAGVVAKKFEVVR